MTAAADLRALERLRAEFGPGLAAGKLALLSRLAHARLRTAAEVARLHEALCFVRAYPDDARVLARADALLRGFERRADLRRHRGALADSGIAGTDLHYRFFAPTARWLARRWPARLTIDWDELDDPSRLEGRLPLLVHPAETPGLDELDLGLRGWIERLKGPRETDAAFLVRRLAELDAGPATRDLLQDELDVPMRLAAGPDTPARTREPMRPARPWFPSRPLGGRPDLRAESRRPPLAVRDATPREGARWIDRARAAMVARARDLDVFAYGDPRDVRLVDAGDGLEFVVIGAVPERRLLLEAVYGWLTLRNGVPTGYVLVSALFGSSEIAYNVFDTFRGGDAAHVYARVLAVTRHLFGADSYTIFPYQLGQGNDEALDSGAWWFYAKLGFAPRDRAARRIAATERARIAKRRTHRSTRATLERLADANLYLDLAKPRHDVIGELALPNVGLRVTDYLAKRFGAARNEAARECAKEATAKLGVHTFAGWSQGERLAWERWAPLVLLVPKLSRWSTPERRAFVEVIRAKGGPRENDFVTKFDAHAKLRRAIGKLTED